MWHTQWVPTPDALPHAITLDFGGDRYDLTALEYVPRQTGRPHGNCGAYEIYASGDGEDFGAEPVAEGTWADTRAAKTVEFAADGAAALRLECFTEAGDRGEWTSASEIYLYGTPAAGGPAPDPPGPDPPGPDPPEPDPPGPGGGVPQKTLPCVQLDNLHR